MRQFILSIIYISLIDVLINVAIIHNQICFMYIFEFKKCNLSNTIK